MTISPITWGLYTVFSLVSIPPVGGKLWVWTGMGNGLLSLKAHLIYFILSEFSEFRFSDISTGYNKNILLSSSLILFVTWEPHQEVRL